MQPEARDPAHLWDMLEAARSIVVSRQDLALNSRFAIVALYGVYRAEQPSMRRGGSGQDREIRVGIGAEVEGDAVAAVGISDSAAGFGHKQRAGGDVPDFAPLTENGVE